MNWWIQNLGDHFVLYCNDYLVAIFPDINLARRFADEYKIEIRD